MTESDLNNLALEVNVNMTMAILAGLAGTSTALESVCSTGDCEYPDFISLGICSYCEDVTSKSTQFCTVSTKEKIGNTSLPVDCSCTSPSGMTLEPELGGASGGSPLAMDINVLYSVSFYAAKYENPVIFYTTQNTTKWEKKPVLTECSIKWCEKLYTNNYYESNGRRSMVVAKSQALTASTDYTGTAYFTLVPDSGYDLTMFLKELFTTSLVNASQGFEPGILLYYGTNLTESIAKMATAMTDYMRSTSTSTNSSVRCEAYTTQTMIHVRWGWITLPIASVAMAFFLFVATAVLAKKHKAILWKTSVFPLLFGTIQTRPEHDIAALPPRVDQIVAMTKRIKFITEQNHPLRMVEE
ncbi:hypothetical protein N7488_009231 [Penicillium malachiteum]|nr:hypothetical protein N7488_009231 [Penicillium malachiteum]